MFILLLVFIWGELATSEINGPRSTPAEINHTQNTPLSSDHRIITSSQHRNATMEDVINEHGRPDVRDDYKIKRLRMVDKKKELPFQNEPVGSRPYLAFFFRLKRKQVKRIIERVN